MVELDARRLRVLHTVALRGGVTAAAASLHVSPSAVSQQLAQLEREAGCDLVERAGRGICLTPAGEALAVHAEQVLHALDRAEAAVAAARSGVAGTVRVGMFPSAGPSSHRRPPRRNCATPRWTSTSAKAKTMPACSTCG
jgi:DNA-binding transcriptional LysR family regulator